MRILFFSLFMIFAVACYAQQTIISSNSLPLGIKVRKAEYALNGEITKSFRSGKTNSEEFYDISTLCKGFDAFGLPKDLVIPVGAQVILFLPTVKKTANSNYTYRTAYTAPDILQNFNYVHDGDSVGFLGASIMSPQAKEEISVLSRTYSPTFGQPRVALTYTTDIKTPEILNIYDDNGNELIQQFEDIGELNKRTYENWIAKGYTDSLDASGLPYEPVFPSHINSFLFKTSELTENAKVRLYNKGERSWIELQAWEFGVASFRTRDIKPGQYQFVVEESNKVYGKKIATYTFTILPPPYPDSIIWLVVIMGLSIICFLLYRIYTKAKLNKLEQQRQLSEAELKAIRAQLNPHFLFNALNAIQNLVNKQDTDNANQYIAKLSKLMRKVLAQSDNAMHTLAEEIEMSKLYLELEKMRTPFTYDLKVATELNQNLLLPSMILQPYLENAVIHGVLNGGGDQILLNIFADRDLCVLEISDNGTGSTKTTGNGKGLKLGKERLDIINKQLDTRAKTSVATSELSTGGYRVTIKLPTDL